MDVIILKNVIDIDGPTTEYYLLIVLFTDDKFLKAQNMKKVVIIYRSGGS